MGKILPWGKFGERPREEAAIHAPKDEANGEKNGGKKVPIWKLPQSLNHSASLASFKYDFHI